MGMRVYSKAYGTTHIRLKVRTLRHPKSFDVNSLSPDKIWGVVRVGKSNNHGTVIDFVQIWEQRIVHTISDK